MPCVTQLSSTWLVRNSSRRPECTALTRCGLTSEFHYLVVDWRKRRIWTIMRWILRTTNFSSRILPTSAPSIRWGRPSTSAGRVYVATTGSCCRLPTLVKKIARVLYNNKKTYAQQDDYIAPWMCVLCMDGFLRISPTHLLHRQWVAHRTELQMTVSALFLTLFCNIWLIRTFQFAANMHYPISTNWLVLSED